MRTEIKIGLAAVGILAIALNIIKVTTQPEETVYLYGAEGNEHDDYYAEFIDAPISWGQYCFTSEDLWDLVLSKPGDVYASMREGSIDCIYQHESLLGIPVVGGGNKGEELSGIFDGIVISNGSDFGDIDYYWPAPSLSEAMATFSDFLIRVQRARADAGLPYLDRYQMRNILSASSDQDEVRDGRWYGEHVDEDLAIDYAVNGIPQPPTPEPEPSPIGFLPGAVYYPLLLDE
jgi:hypothetical protein